MRNMVLAARNRTPLPSEETLAAETDQTAECSKIALPIGLKRAV